MKIKVLFILLLLSHFVNGQISINKNPFTSAFTTSSVDVIGFSFSNKTLVAGKLYIFFSAATGANNNPSLTGTTLTWTPLVAIGNSTMRMNVWYVIPTTTVVNETTSCSWGVAGTTGTTGAMWEVSGVNTQNAIVQAVTGGATSANPSITLSSISSSNNAIIAFFFNDASPFGGTEESGWTEDFDDGYSTPTTGSYVMSRLRTTDNTPTVTASSSTWIGMAIEIRAGRRAVVTN